MLFERNAVGEIISKDNPLAVHIHKELNLWLPIHSKMWNYEQLKNNELKLKEAANDPDNADIEEALNDLARKVSSLMDEIFEDND
jgi:hypothetical protein